MSYPLQPISRPIFARKTVTLATHHTPAMPEYLGHSISSLSSNGSPLFVASAAKCLGQSSLQLWSCDPQLNRLDSKAITGEITSTCMARTDLAAAATCDGSLAIFHIKDNYLNEVFRSNLAKGCINCINYNNDNGQLVIASDSGDVSVISPAQLSSNPVTRSVSKLPLTCVDASSAKEVVLGTTAGHLKVIDLRRSEGSDVKTLSMASANSITSVTRNPVCPQFVVCGNESGTMCLWDMRKECEPILQVSSHESSITGLLYDVNQVQRLYSASLDGQILRWEFEQSQMKTVDPLVRPINLSGPSINCFCLAGKSNGKTQLIYATDREVLYQL